MFPPIPRSPQPLRSFNTIVFVRPPVGRHNRYVVSTHLLFFTPLGRHSRCVVSTQLVLIAPPWSPQGAAAEQFEFFPPPCAGTSAAQFDYHFSQPLHRLSATYFLYAPLRQHSRFATQVSLLVSIPPAPAQPLRSLGVAPLFFAPLRRHSRCASSVSPRWWPQPMRSFNAFVFFSPPWVATAAA